MNLGNQSNIFPKIPEIKGTIHILLVGLASNYLISFPFIKILIDPSTEHFFTVHGMFFTQVDVKIFFFNHHTLIG